MQHDTKRTRQCWALGIFIAATILVSVASERAQAETTSSDWAPFVGEFQMWCTASTGIAGPCSSHHNGWAIDIDIPFNDPIYAAGSGVVAWIGDGCSPTGGDGHCNNRAGNYVAIDHGDHYSRYIHLASLADGIEIGTQVEAGAIVGFSGASGTWDGGVHLHYDEIDYPLSATRRIFFGPMLACHDGVAVQYPDILGTSDWQAVPHGTVLRNDGYECLGGVTPPPTLPPPPVELQPGGAVGMAFGDFNSDEIDDLAIGVPGEGVRKRNDAGKAIILYGATGGPSDQKEALRQRRPLRGRAESGDMFGAALASGDFDCDGTDDLAIGIPREDVRGRVDAGAVAVTYGGTSGLDNRDVVFYQGKWLSGRAEAGDLTGGALSAGDFNGDGCDDLAVGSPGEDIQSFIDAGSAAIIFGSPEGFGPSSESTPQLYQGHYFSGFPESGDTLGATLVAGDFNCDGIDDLAAGVPSESIDNTTRAGAVSILFGDSGIFGRDPITLWQSGGIAGILESGDRVGAALAAGDVNSDGCSDLIVGAPSEDLIGGSEAGVVSIVFGSTTGLSESQVFYQETGGFGETIEKGDLFGAAVAAADINCDGFDDVVVGAPGEDLHGVSNAGWVGVLFGAASGLSDQSISLYQDEGGLPGKNEPNDILGTSLVGGEMTGDICDDIAIGSPGETVGSKEDAGRILIVVGAETGPMSATSHYESKNLPGKSEPGDFFGGPGFWALLGLSLN